MTVDVSRILKEIGGRIDIDGEVFLSDTGFLGEMYDINNPLSIRGSISNNGKSLIMRSSCTGTMKTQCARCMKDIIVKIDTDIEENLARDGSNISGEEDVILFRDTAIDIDDIVRDNIAMSVPGKYLCKEDCLGLCQQCGADLNEGECGCEKEFIDPGWASLIDIMNKEN